MRGSGGAFPRDLPGERAFSRARRWTPEDLSQCYQCGYEPHNSGTLPKVRDTLIAVVAASLALVICGYHMRAHGYGGWIWGLADNPERPGGTRFKARAVKGPDIMAIFGAVLTWGLTASAKGLAMISGRSAKRVSTFGRNRRPPVADGPRAIVPGGDGRYRATAAAPVSCLPLR